MSNSAHSCGEKLPLLWAVAFRSLPRDGRELPASKRGTWTAAGTELRRTRFPVMPRYYFNIKGDYPHQDELGEELADDASAWAEALRHGRDVEDKLKPGQRWLLYVVEDKTPVFVITMTSRRLR